MIVRWNLFIMIFCSSFDEIIVYSYFEFGFSGNYNNSIIKTFGIIIAILSIALMLKLYYDTVKIAYTFQKVKRQVIDMKNEADQ